MARPGCVYGTWKGHIRLEKLQSRDDWYHAVQPPEVHCADQRQWYLPRSKFNAHALQPRASPKYCKASASMAGLKSESNSPRRMQSRKARRVLCEESCM